MTSTLIQGGELVDPLNGVHGTADVLFADGGVAEVGRDLRVPRGAQVVDASGLLVLPGLVDSHTHVGTPYRPTLTEPNCRKCRSNANAVVIPSRSITTFLEQSVKLQSLSRNRWNVSQVRRISSLVR